MRTIAFIGGSGLAEGLESTLDNVETVSPTTNEYGRVMTHYIGGKDGLRVVILPRHGEGDEFRSPATLVKEGGFEANLWQLHAYGVERIIAFSAVGWLDRMPLADTGTFLVPHRYHRGFGMREVSFNRDATDTFPNMGEPFDPRLRAQTVKAIRAAGYTAIDGGLYCNNGGDAFETTDEIRSIRRLTKPTLLERLRFWKRRLRVVGMTVGYELVLTKQLGIPYAALCNAVNPAQGLSRIIVSDEQTHAVMAVAAAKNAEITATLIASLGRRLR